MLKVQHSIYFIKDELRFHPLFLPVIVLLIFIFPLTTTFSAKAAESPPIQLATQFREDIDITEYYVSEKLDGIRAYWDGHHLISKQGNIFTAPTWFTESFPTEPMDGELWIARQNFEKVSGIVRTQDANNLHWQLVTYMIFDLPQNDSPFKQRISAMKKLLANSNSQYLAMIKQQKLTSNTSLQKLLKEVVEQQGEGLMLHHQDALYQNKRTQDLMKLKMYEDAEAIVIAHIPGKGKYKGQLGSLLVETESGIRFKLGTGFSDEERKNPPGIGSVVTYRFTGKTRNNIPRFASYMRVRVIY